MFEVRAKHCAFCDERVCAAQLARVLIKACVVQVTEAMPSAAHERAACKAGLTDLDKALLSQAGVATVGVNVVRGSWYERVWTALPNAAGSRAATVASRSAVAPQRRSSRLRDVPVRYQLSPDNAPERALIFDEQVRYASCSSATCVHQILACYVVRTVS